MMTCECHHFAVSLGSEEAIISRLDSTHQEERNPGGGDGPLYGVSGKGVDIMMGEYAPSGVYNKWWGSLHQGGRLVVDHCWTWLVCHFLLLYLLDECCEVVNDSVCGRLCPQSTVYGQLSCK